MMTVLWAGVISDRWFTFSAPPAAVRAALADTDRYREWWPWLAEFESDGLHAGARWRCAVRSPLRTMLRFRLLIDRADDHVIAARLVGDLEGQARIWLQPSSEPEGTELHFEASIQPAGTAIAALTRLMPSVAQWSHDKIVEIAAAQFTEVLAARVQRTPT